MSGGAFDHAYWKVDQFTEELEFRLSNDDNQLKSETKEVLRNLIVKSDSFVEMMRAVEWFYSGDISEEEMMKRIKENE